MRLASFLIALVVMIGIAWTVRRLFGIDYFFNAIFVSVVGLGLSDVIYRLMKRNAADA